MVPYPVIDAENGVRLFDADLESAIRSSRYDERAILKEMAKFYSELYEISAPGFRFPNPQASVAGSIAFVKRRINELGEDLDRERANPTPLYDSLSFADKIREQLGFVAAMPDFSATREEMETEAQYYSRYVRRVTAEAEIIALWNSL